MAPLASANNPKATLDRVTATSIRAQLAFSEGVAPGRCSVDQQRRPGRHSATAEQRQKRSECSKEDNKRLFEFYIRSEPERPG